MIKMSSRDFVKLFQRHCEVHTVKVTFIRYTSAECQENFFLNCLNERDSKHLHLAIKFYLFIFFIAAFDQKIRNYFYNVQIIELVCATTFNNVMFKWSF